MRLRDGIISLDEIRKSSWSGGTTEEIFIYPEDKKYEDKDFTYRISVATIDEEESTFTELPGYDRVLMPLTNKVTLEKEGVKVELEPFELLKFSGRERVVSYGRTKDLNLMMKEGSKARMEVLTDITSIKLDTREAQLAIIINVDDKGNFYNIEEIRFKNKGNELSFSMGREITAVIISLPDMEI